MQSEYVWAKRNWICEKKIPQEQVYSENVQKFQIEYRLQLHSTVIISKASLSLLFLLLVTTDMDLTQLICNYRTYW